MGLLGKIAYGVVVILLIAVLALGYFGYVPGLSELMGSNYPRDLGVSATAISGSQMNSKLGVKFTTLPAENVGKASVEESGSQQVNLEFTSEEITSLINDHASRWKYYPIEYVQVKINTDDTIELSGVLRVDRWPGYADSIGLSESTRSLVRPYLGYVQTNPAVYLKGTLSFQGSPELELYEVQVGRVVVPRLLIDQYIGYVESFVSYVAKLYQIDIDQIYCEDGVMFVVGSIPTDVALSPPTDKSLGRMGFWAPNRDDAIRAFEVVTLVYVLANFLRAQMSWIGKKLGDMLPTGVQVWLENYLSSKSEISVEESKGSALKLTRGELIGYGVALILFTLAFSYVGSTTLEEMLRSIPLVLATSILIEFLKNYLLNAFSRSRGAWTEYRLWPLGVFMFIFSSFAFKTPFSSPSKSAQSEGKQINLIEGLIALNSVLIVTALAGAFYWLKIQGMSDIGNIGVQMCLLSAFFDSIPVSPLNGKTIWDWNKLASIVLLFVTFLLNIYWITYV